MKKLMEYLTTYPKTVSFFDGIKHKIDVDSKDGVEQLHIVVKKSFEELTKIFTDEGFTKVKLEHKQPDQIGSGLNLKLKKPWEMHIRMVDLKKGLIGIHAKRINRNPCRSRSLKGLSSAFVLTKNTSSL
jgi:hypothetical protein